MKEVCKFEVASSTAEEKLIVEKASSKQEKANIDERAVAVFSYKNIVYCGSGLSKAAR